MEPAKSHPLSYSESLPISPYVQAILDHIIEADSLRKGNELTSSSASTSLLQFNTHPPYSMINPNAVTVKMVWARPNDNGLPAILIRDTKASISVGTAIFSRDMLGNGRVEKIEKMKGRYIYLHIEFDNYATPRAAPIKKTVVIPAANVQLVGWGRMRSWVEWIIHPLYRYRRITT